MSVKYVSKETKTVTDSYTGKHPATCLDMKVLLYVVWHVVATY